MVYPVPEKSFRYIMLFQDHRSYSSAAMVHMPSPPENPPDGMQAEPDGRQDISDSDNLPILYSLLLFLSLYAMCGYRNRFGGIRPCKQQNRHTVLLSVLMCKQMLLTVFIITGAFRTETEFQFFTVFFCTSADCTAMLRTLC